MGALPKRKISKSRKNGRRSHHAISTPAMSINPRTGEMIPPHTIDLKTGKYRDKQLLRPKD